MSKNVNQSKRIYDKQTKTWYEVTPEQYKEFDRYRTNKRKREQYHGRCMCPRQKWWICDGMCGDCEFHSSGDTLSLDMPMANSDGEETTLLDTLIDPSPTPEDIATDRAALDFLFERLNELMPEARTIGELRLEGLSDEVIAERIGIKRTTFRSRLAKAKAELMKDYPDFFNM